MTWIVGESGLVLMQWSRYIYIYMMDVVFFLDLLILYTISITFYKKNNSETEKDFVFNFPLRKIHYNFQSESTNYSMQHQIKVDLLNVKLAATTVPLHTTTAKKNEKATFEIYLQHTESTRKSSCNYTKPTVPIAHHLCFKRSLAQNTYQIFAPRLTKKRRKKLQRTHNLLERSVTQKLSRSFLRAFLFLHYIHLRIRPFSPCIHTRRRGSAQCVVHFCCCCILMRRARSLA